MENQECYLKNAKQTKGKCCKIKKKNQNVIKTSETIILLEKQLRKQILRERRHLKSAKVSN